MIQRLFLLLLVCLIAGHCFHSFRPFRVGIHPTFGANFLVPFRCKETVTMTIQRSTDPTGQTQTQLGGFQEMRGTRNNQTQQARAKVEAGEGADD